MKGRGRREGVVQFKGNEIGSEDAKEHGKRRKNRGGAVEAVTVGNLAGGIRGWEKRAAIWIKIPRGL